MPPSTDEQTIFWEIQLSIAKAVAALKKPSLARLHHDIVEEIGQRPGKKLIDYFLEIARIPEEEKEEYFGYIGITPKKKGDRFSQLADTIACGDAPTVLNFRQSYSEAFGEPPSLKLIEYFLQKIPEPPKVRVNKGRAESQMAFVERTATAPNATVLKFRKSFANQFGTPPAADLTEHFLEKLQEKPAISANTMMPLDSESGIDFAKRAARENVTTILQFRKEYENSYNEAPASELIDMFIKNLPKV